MYKFIFFKNLYLYATILNIYKLNFKLKLIYPYRFRYSWINIKNNFNKFFIKSFEFFYFTEFFQIYNFKKLNKLYYIKNIIFFKNKTSFFKKINSLKSIFISKINFNKFHFFKKNLYNCKKKRLNKNKIFYKNFEFVDKKLEIYINNRNILKNYFNLNKKKKLFINKYFKKLLKINIEQYLNVIEFSLEKLLINSNFLLNKKDFFFFLKNKYIYLNNKLILKNQIINQFDIININYNKYYFFLYRDYLNKINFNFNKYSFFKKLYKFKKTDIKRDLIFINKIIFFKNDVPKFLEIDYISMSLILLYKNIVISNLNYFNLKLLNIFLKRLYNWKYII